MAKLIRVGDWTGGVRGTAVFIHGLGGHPYSTWQRAGIETFWPAWLSRDVEGLAVFTLGYISPPTNWPGTAMPLLDEAANILRLLINEPALRKGPITFVSHSLGGLIVKQLMRSAREQSSNPIVADFFDRVRHVVFVATPHTGSGKATLLEKIGFLVWGSDSISDLVVNKPELRDLNIGYRGLAESKSTELCHLVYYEMVDTAFGRIVQPNSAVPGLPRCIPTPIREDHMTICKPNDRNELLYVEIRNLLLGKTAPLENVGTFQSYVLEPFKVERSWTHLIPKLVRLAMVAVVVIAGWLTFPKFSDFSQSQVDLHRKVALVDDKLSDVKSRSEDAARLARETFELVRKLQFVSTAAAAPGDEKAITAAVLSAVNGAADGDPRFTTAYALLKQGETTKAEELFRAVAEEESSQAKANGNEAATAFRNLGAISRLSDPKKARDAYGRALTFNPDDIEALYWHGLLNLWAENLPVAERSLTQFLKIALISNDPREIHRAYMRLGELQVLRGNIALAIEYSSKAEEIAEKSAKANPKDFEWQRDWANTVEKSGDILVEQGKFSAALSKFEADREIVERLVKEDAGNILWRKDQSIVYERIGDALLGLDRSVEALKYYNIALSLADSLVTANPDYPEWLRQQAVMLAKISRVLEKHGDGRLALEKASAALAVRNRLMKLDGSNGDFQDSVALSLIDVGDLLRSSGDLKGALANYKSAFAIAEGLAKSDPDHLGWQIHLAICYSRLAIMDDQNNDRRRALDP